MSKRKAKDKSAADTEPLFATYAALDRAKRETESKAARPSEKAVSDAKNWVDYNKK